MYHELLRGRELFERLLGIDKLIAEQVRSAGCECGGRLNRAAYRRKPRGLPEELGPEHSVRESFCCDRDGCRKRATPVSVRFLGSRVYVGVAVVVAAAAEGGVTKRRMKLLRDLIGSSLDARTVKRWVAWWRKTLPESRFWQTVRGRLRAPIEVARMPLSLLEVFYGERAEQAMVNLLRLLMPISVGQAR